MNNTIYIPVNTCDASLGEALAIVNIITSQMDVAQREAYKEQLASMLLNKQTEDHSNNAKENTVNNSATSSNNVKENTDNIATPSSNGVKESTVNIVTPSTSNTKESTDATEQQHKTKTVYLQPGTAIYEQIKELQKEVANTDTVPIIRAWYAKENGRVGISSTKLSDAADLVMLLKSLKK